jgi:hypothetical protein
LHGTAVQEFGIFTAHRCKHKKYTFRLNIVQTRPNPENWQAYILSISTNLLTQAWTAWKLSNYLIHVIDEKNHPEIYGSERLWNIRMVFLGKQRERDLQ